MKKSLYSSVAIVLVLAVGMIVYFRFFGTDGTPVNTNTNTVVLDLVNEPTNTALNTNAGTNSNTPAIGGSASGGNTNAAANVNASTGTAVRITTSGFSPSTVTVKAGTVVTWTNSSGSEVRIASDPHPTHTDLPGLDSSTLNDGETYSFTFTKVGTWGYHDHFDPTTKGSVTIQ